MKSAHFRRALTVTGYLLADGTPAPGLTQSGNDNTWRLRSVLSDSRIGLNADAVFSSQNTPTSIFKDSGDAFPSDDEVHRWHEAAWNVSLAPLLWIVTPIDVRLYNCYASPTRQQDDGPRFAHPLDVFAFDTENRLEALDAMCGRLATETGAFWSSAIGRRIDRQFRVDRQLLNEINALEAHLTLLPPSGTQPLPDARAEVGASRDFAQRLIGRCIFTSYLIDRGIAQPFLPPELSPDVAQMFANIDTSFALFGWLRQTFNGDLFPMDDPGAEHERLGDAHLSLLRDFIEGRSLIASQRGQGRLFRFRYEAIPVDLISAIYQQFARSSAAEEAHVQGLHYTPSELVHLTLDPVFEGIDPKARIIDPTCGSGAFLVEAFRRLVWKNSQNAPPSRAIVRNVLYNQLFGIDVNRSALGIAAFSLYLAALELNEEPVANASELRFDRLIGTTLFRADTIHDALPSEVTRAPFEAVVGNPPWTFVRRPTTQPRRAQQAGAARPRRSPDHAFLAVATRLAGGSGRIGMVMKASPFFSRDPHAVEARQTLFQKVKTAALINLSALRKEELFPDATGPALLFFARCTLMDQRDRLLLGSMPWTPDFRRNGVFYIGPGELRSLPAARVMRTPAMLKAATFGTARDGWLIERLERQFPVLDTILTNAGVVSLRERGQGFQVVGDLNTPPQRYYDLPVLTPDVYTPFRLSRPSLESFEHVTLHRPREESIFLGPLLICPKASFKNASELGRYSATVSPDDVLYNESFYGISFSKRPSWAQIISAILNSSLATFQFAFGGGGWGLERPTVEPKDLLSLRVPDLDNTDPRLLDAVIRAEAAAADNPRDLARLDSLDQAVFELFGLERDETILARDSVARARMLLFEGRAQRQESIDPPTIVSLTSYASEVVHVVNGYLRARNERHLQATVYLRTQTRPRLDDSTRAITAVRFVMVSGPASDIPLVRQGDPAETTHLLSLLRGQLNVSIPPYLNERRRLRIYGSNDVFFLKPSEARCWTRTVGINDADVILADHWIRG
jgi:N-6 DNA Methylase